MNGQLVPISNLPSRGYSYPQDIEIYVRPLNIKEQIDMSRYGITTAEYYTVILNGITIRGNFHKDNLLQSDVQFMDIVRRLYSFDTKDEIVIKDKCAYQDCGAPFEYSFTLDKIDFTEFNPDIFGKTFKFKEGEEDELEVVVSPLTIKEYINMSRKFKNFTDKKTMLSDMFLEYCCTCIRDVVGREFRDLKDRNSFLKGYLGDLCRDKDVKVLKAIENETTIEVKPFKFICESCGRETEVVVEPTSNFQQ